MTHDGNGAKKGSPATRLWKTLTKPSIRYSLGTLVAGGVIAGVILWGGFNWAMELTNTETFCISCHEMEENVYAEYKKSLHYSNRTGVRATCPDCHVPKEWVYKLRRKIQATNELFHHFLGSVDTPAKFEAKRIELAKYVWASMRATDSRECRNCHDFEAMDFTYQEKRARKRHAEGKEEGKTCIDCHKGVAHELPAGAFEAEKALSMN